MQHVHIESYRENGLFLFYATLFLPNSSAWVLPRYMIFVLMWACGSPYPYWLKVRSLDSVGRFPSDKQPGEHLALLQLPMLGGLSSKLRISMGVASPCCFGHTIFIECSARLEAWQPWELGSAPMGGVTHGLTTAGINSKIKCHVVLSDVTHEKMFAFQQFVASMLFASVLPPRRQDLERHVETLQRGEPVEVVAETGLKPAGELLFFGLEPQWWCEKLWFWIWDYCCWWRKKHITFVRDHSETVLNMKPPMTS